MWIDMWIYMWIYMWTYVLFFSEVTLKHQLSVCLCQYKADINIISAKCNLF